MGKEQEDRENEVISSFGSFSADLVLVRCLNRRFDGQRYAVYVGTRQIHTFWSQMKNLGCKWVIMVSRNT